MHLILGPAKKSAQQSNNPRPPFLTEQLEGEPITYDVIAKRFPSITLAEVLRAEANFAEADANGDGIVDITGGCKVLLSRLMIVPSP
jgi:hypothetical protein